MGSTARFRSGWGDESLRDVAVEPVLSVHTRVMGPLEVRMSAHRLGEILQKQIEFPRWARATVVVVVGRPARTTIVVSKYKLTAND